MDLDLFGGFDGEVNEAELQKVAAAAGEPSDTRKAKKHRTESYKSSAGVAAASAPAQEESEVVIMQNSATVTSDKGDRVTTMTAMPASYVPTSGSGSVGGSSSSDGAATTADSTLTVPRAPAKVYGFKLDTFQQEAVNYIERGESVLVAAHTSAGKTAVAEYAIAKSLRDGQRVIYTSPIKALSNQKFRDLQEEFTDVGLMTGDMTINPNATCLIMTTEILRSMLYRGSEVMREVAWVIFDEVHYMRDKERGLVWEESIILLPHKVRFVFLSATIPNAKEFVGWIAKIHHQPCHVVYTDYRPTPLQHFVYPMGADGLYLVVDEKGRFREDNFQKAMSLLQLPDTSAGEGGSSGKDGKKGKKVMNGKGAGPNSDLFKIVKLIMERNLDPCIVFSFSKKDCETYALQMARLDFNNAEEKALIEKVFLNALDALSEDDQQLPQVQTILPLLKNGVGIHHGGLLPILKEVIEILFQEGLIKCLFATETFSIGINMPAKTVVFTATRKFDGKDFRWITSGEYIQMSGRAGRRGKDDKGIVIQMLDEKMEPDVAKGMVYGLPDELYSSYHVSYNMVMNMLRVEDADPENLLKASFHQFQQEQQAPALENQANELQREANSLVLLPMDESALATGGAEGAIVVSPSSSSSSSAAPAATSTLAEQSEVITAVSEYANMMSLTRSISAEISSILRKPEYCLPFLQPGRLLYIIDSNVPAPVAKASSSSANASAAPAEDVVWGWGVVVNLLKDKANSNAFTAENCIGFDPAEMNANRGMGKAYILDVLLEVVKKPAAAAGGNSNSSGKVEYQSAAAAGATKQTEMVVYHVALSAVRQFSAVRLTLPPDMRKDAARGEVKRTVGEVKKRFEGKDAGGVPLLDPIKDLGVTDENYAVLKAREAELRTRLEGYKPFHNLLRKANRVIEAHNEKLTKAAAASGSRAAVETVPLITEAEALRRYAMKMELIESAKAIRTTARESQAVTMRAELKKMMRVLRRMGYISSAGVLETKGRFACELNTGDELVLTDMIFEGVFNDLSVDQSVALLSCFVHKEGGGKKDKQGGGSAGADGNIAGVRNDLQAPLRQLLTIAGNVAKVSIDAKMTMDEAEYVASFNPGMIEVVFQWSAGAKFIEICRLTEIFEGSIIRTIRRLEELLRQLGSACMAIGNQELRNKFEEGASKIRRGVIFAASLYL